jgi:TolB-like protein/DNA-binding winged helix-turn-helix (wHTH) protein
MPAATSGVYRFANFTFDTRTGELTSSGDKVPLRDQPQQILSALLEHHGQLLTREELANRLWPDGTFVDFDRGLNKAVNHLREALGDSAEQPRFVETLPRKGYRFIAPVTNGIERTPEVLVEVPPRPNLQRQLIAVGLVLICSVIAIALNAGGSRRWLSVRFQKAPQISAIAVIPLENLSGDPEQEYFADGITDALITDLAKIGDLRVTSRTSVIRYKRTKKTISDIGRELNVDAIVEGTVTRSGNRVRITAQLIQVATDMHLWAETYERDLSEILNLQNDVATDIARRINIVVKPQEKLRSVDPRAYGLYLKGRYYFNQYTSVGWQQAIDNYNQAIEADPNFAPAYSGLAVTYIVAGAYASIPSQEALTRGKAAALKAIQLDDHLASAHYALATAYTWYDWDWTNAEKEFRRALELNPNDALGRNWHGAYLSVRGRHNEAIDEQERARELDPQSLIINANLARALYWGRRYDEAITQAKRTLEIDPKFGVAIFWLEGSLRHKGLLNEAVALRKASTTPERSKAIDGVMENGGFERLLAETGAMFKQNGAPFEAARCYAQVGQKDVALELLEDCFSSRCASMVTVTAEPDFEVLAGERRFQELVRKVGLE